jgi:hypothetical protein
MIWALLNFGLSIWFWRDSVKCFEQERNGFGWFLIVASAVNFASGMSFLVSM